MEYKTFAYLTNFFFLGENISNRILTLRKFSHFLNDDVMVCNFRVLAYFCLFFSLKIVVF